MFGIPLCYVPSTFAKYLMLNDTTGSSRKYVMYVARVWIFYFVWMLYKVKLINLCIWKIDIIPLLILYSYSLIYSEHLTNLFQDMSMFSDCICIGNMCCSRIKTFSHMDHYNKQVFWLFEKFTTCILWYWITIPSNQFQVQKWKL